MGSRADESVQRTVSVDLLDGCWAKVDRFESGQPDRVARWNANDLLRVAEVEWLTRIEKLAL